MTHMFNKCLAEKYGLFPGKSGQETPKEPKHKGKGKKSAMLESDSASAAHEKKDILEEPPMTIIQSMQVGSFAINRIINELKPRYVVLYDSEISTVRQLEVFQASHPNFKLKVFFLMFGKSVEEQAYLSSLRREKMAMEMLIKEKTVMVVPNEREGRGEDNLDLVRGSGKASDIILNVRNSKTRKGGANEGLQSVPKVIVDMREFRSELPSLLHKRGIGKVLS